MDLVQTPISLDDVTINPEYADMVPPQSKEKFEELKQSISENGLYEPIVINLKKQILDGHHRMRACQAVNVIPRFRAKDFKTKDEERLYVIETNLFRRQLSVYLQVELREKIERIKAKQRKSDGARYGNVAISSKGQTREIIANKIPNVKSRTVGKALYVIDHGTPEIQEAAKLGKNKGGISINAAYKRTKNRIKESKKVEEVKIQPVKPWIKHCDYQTLIKEIGPSSVDLLITDPPYMTDVENIDQFVSWLNPVLETLKDTGQAYIFTGAYYPELKAYINQLDKDQGKRFTKQILVWEYRNTLGPSPKEKYKQNWQAIFYLRGSDANAINTESLIEKFTVQQFNMPGMLGQSINYHTWEKPLDLAKQLIRHGSTPDSFVFDPFAGTGTFLLAAAELGRQNIGSDIDPNMIEIAKKRGCQLK